MAADEDQPQQVVLHDLLGRQVRLREFHHPLSVLLFVRADAFPPDDVDRLPPRGHGQPRARLRRYSRDRPSPERRQRRLLYCVLRELHVTERPDQGGENPRTLDPDGLGDYVVLRPHGYLATMTGRTSTAPPPGQAAGMSAAIFTASSRSAASIR